ncbi:unnamed protein product, partial [Discosporangium mesarthrocarpum]
MRALGVGDSQGSCEFHGFCLRLFPLFSGTFCLLLDKTKGVKEGHMLLSAVMRVRVRARFMVGASLCGKMPLCATVASLMSSTILHLCTSAVELSMTCELWLPDQMSELTLTLNTLPVSRWITHPCPPCPLKVLVALRQEMASSVNRR